MTELDSARLFAGDRRTLSRAITLIESRRQEDRQSARALLEDALPRTGHSFRVGITGSPGTGKSTFIDALGTQLTAAGHKVAVLAIDPTSPRGGGSILGDKTRMEALSQQPNAYIRPSPAGDSLGGVAHKTRETMLLCEAAGFDVVIVETVGVGQSEVEIADMVDFFAVLVLPNAGDELQGIKRGVIEFADLVVVNKADGDAVAAAERTRAQYQSALQLLFTAGDWQPRVICCSALEHAHIEEFWETVEEFSDQARASGELALERSQQNVRWLNKLTREIYDRRLREHPEFARAQARLERLVRDGDVTPLSAAEELARIIES